MDKMTVKLMTTCFLLPSLVITLAVTEKGTLYSSGKTGDKELLTGVLQDEPNYSSLFSSYSTVENAPKNAPKTTPNRALCSLKEMTDEGSQQTPKTFNDLSLVENNKPNPFKLLYGWSEIDFTWPSEDARAQAIAFGNYQPHKILILDVDVYERNGKQKVFVTLPRGEGVPAALATVSSEGDPKSPKLAPYPDWSWHNGSCDGISSVFRVQVDECGRLWVLDLGNEERLCSPQILIFDLRDDSLIYRYRFPSDVIRPGSLLVTIAVDIRNGECAKPYAYVADITNPAIIVVNVTLKKSWRVEHPSFEPIKTNSTFRVADGEFSLMDGILGLALGPVRNRDRRVYYHPLASVYESWVPASVLRSAGLFQNGRNYAPDYFQTYPVQRPSQSAAHVMDDKGILFSSLLSEMAITCWNSEQPYSEETLQTVAVDTQDLQFPSGAKIHDGQLWILTSRYQNIAANIMNWTDINYRILSAPVEDLVRDTACNERST